MCYSFFVLIKNFSSVSAHIISQFALEAYVFYLFIKTKIMESQCEANALKNKNKLIKRQHYAEILLWYFYFIP